jgi:hypothetical protein
LAANSAGVNLTTKVKLSYGQQQKQFKIIHLRLSEAYGTRVELHDGRGIIRGT